MTALASQPQSSYPLFEYTPPDKGLTNIVEINALLSGYRWLGKNSSGQTLISYSFLNNSSSFVSNYSSVQEPSGRTYFSEEVRSLTRTILDQISEVCNLVFVEVPDNANEAGVIRFGYSQIVAAKQSGAWAYGPGSSPRSGDVWINPDYADKQIASWGYTLGNMILHETLHALGLKHPFESDGGYRITLTRELDTQANTVMSYTPTLGSTRQWLSHWPQEPMRLDTLALQTLYGFSQYNSGDTHYDLSSNYFHQQLRTLWDSDGRDVLDASQLNGNAILDMVPGSSNDIGQSVESSANPYTKTMFIAFNTWIEDAIGSPYGDTITGNSQANRITGMAGDDEIYGSQGGDFIDGGSGNDSLIWDQSIKQFVIRNLDNVLHLITPTGDRQIIQNIERFRFADQDYTELQIKNHILASLTWPSPLIPFNNISNTKLVRESNGMYRIGEGGHSYLINFKPDLVGNNLDYSTIQIITPSDKTEIILNKDLTLSNSIEKILNQNSAIGLWSYLLSGHDHLILSPLSDQIRSGFGDDWIYGLAGNDLIDCGEGNDLLDGGVGDDLLIGGNGDDIYIIDSSKDRILDKSGFDHIKSYLSNISLDFYKNIEAVQYIGLSSSRLLGNRLDNHLIGGDLDDWIDGGMGQDSLTGKAGADTFSFSSSLKSGPDTITDFQAGVDRLALSGKTFSSLKSSTTLIQNWVINEAIDANDYIIYNPSNQTLFYDADGSLQKHQPVAIFTGIAFIEVNDIFIFNP